MFSQFLFLRLIGVFLMQTYFVPDEYWQSLEVAHHMVFGYGYLTWEWREQLRSIVFPGFFALVYKILHYLNLDFVLFLTLVPRLCCAALTAASDDAAVKLAEKVYGRSVRGSAALCLASSWFVQYCGGRTISGVPETTATMWALCAYPWLPRTGDVSVSYLWWVGLGCALRPTTAVLFLPLFAAQLLCSTRRLVLLCRAAALAAVVSCAVCVLDSLYYGQPTFVPWNFVKFNVLSDLADHYGRHPWHWYVTSGLPSALGPHTALLLPALLHTFLRGAWGPRLLLSSCACTLACYSMIGHKEIRLLLPLLPCLLVLCGHQLTLLQKTWARSEWYRLGRVGLLAWLVCPSAALVLYFGLAHQRGAVAIMEDLRTLLVLVPAAPSVLFLTPCHATPLYSHLHVPVPVRFLTCEPNLQFTPHYIDESDKFYESPELWLASHLPPTPRREEALKRHHEEAIEGSHNNTSASFCVRKHSMASMYRYEVADPMPSYPSHIVMFDSLATSLASFLECSGYELCAQAFHSFVKEKHRGKYIQVYCTSGT